MTKTKSKIKTILFDFDGTMADTFTELVKIYNEIAPAYKCKKVDEGDIEKLRNKRPQDFMADYNVTKLNLPFLVLKGRKLLRERMHEILPFENLVEVIRELRSMGYQLGILTSNSQKNIHLFLKHQRINDLFSFVYNGKNIFGKSKKLKNIFAEQDLTNEQVLMIGDETRDIEAAHKVKVKIIAVSWGFNSKKVLKKQKPYKLVDNPLELLSVIREM